MKWVIIGVLVAGMCFHARAQTTITNIDDDPITFPNNYNNNLQEWAWVNGAAIGCSSCTDFVTGNMSHGCVYCLDGQSLQMNYVNPGGQNCSNGCYQDVQFLNRIYMNDTASSAGYLTTDMWATTNSVGDQHNENLEYSLEQDVTDPSPGSSDRYIYGLNCTNLDSGRIWKVWWGDHVNSNGTLGAWVNAKWHGGQTIPCQQFDAPNFDHLIFHFQRVDNSGCTACTKYLDFTVVHNGTVYYYPLDGDMIFGSLTKQPHWAAGLITAMQLDGDHNDDEYSVWADKWEVCYAPPGPTNPCS